MEASLRAESSPDAAGPEACPAVTVVMPVRNEAASIRESLGAVLNQDYPAGRLEVIVVDGMSRDETPSIVREVMTRHGNVRLIENPRGIVPSGLNDAIRAATGQVIVRVDGHTVVEPDYVAECVAALRRSGAENVGGPMRAEGSGWFGSAVALATSSRFGMGGARFHYSGLEEPVDTVYLGAWRRSTFERFGLFDEEMVRNQDDEFNYRLRSRGGSVLLSPKIRSRYTVRGTPASLWRQYFQYGFWKVRVVQKHPGQIRPRHLAPPALVGALLGPVAASAIEPRFAILGGAVAGAYAVATFVASARIASLSGWRRLPALALAFAILHLGYGLGFLAGLGRYAFRWRDR